MASILELLASRNRQRQQSRPPGDRQGMISAIVLRTDNQRFIISDGANSFQADSMIAERLREGDRVWVAVGRGTAIIMGRQGRDVAFAEET